MKLYGHFFSTPSVQVRLAASAAGLDIEYEHIDLATGAHRTDDYKAINKFGRVPALVDGDFHLGESNAITRYIATKAGGALYPDDLQSRAMIDQWMDYSVLHVRFNINRLFFNRVLAPFLKVPVDEKSMAEAEKLLGGILLIVEDTLAANEFLTGDALSLADVTMLTAFEPCEMASFQLSDYPAIVKWRQRLMVSDWYQKVHTHFGAEMNG